MPEKPAKKSASSAISSPAEDDAAGVHSEEQTSVQLSPQLLQAIQLCIAQSMESQLEKMGIPQLVSDVQALKARAS